MPVCVFYFVCLLAQFCINFNGGVSRREHESEIDRADKREYMKIINTFVEFQIDVIMMMLIKSEVLPGILNMKHRVL